MFRRLKNLAPDLIYRIAIILVSSLYLRKFFQMFDGYQYPTWGYSTYLVNYQGGFVRRGLPGEFLLQLYKITGIDPYIFLMSAYCLLLSLILILWVRYIGRFDLISRMLLLLNPAFIVMPLSQDSSLLCKEWIIGTILVSFAHLSLQRKRHRMSHSSYEIIVLWVYIPTLGLLALSHEEQFFLLPIYLFLFINATKTFDNSFRWTTFFRPIPLIMMCTQTFILIAVVKHHGSPKQAKEVFESIPSNFQARQYIIDSMGWSLDQSRAMTNTLLTSPSTIFTFAVCILLGPVLIYFLISGYEKRYRITHFLLLLPLGLLFFVGWDWGRWILLVTFSVIALTYFQDMESPKLNMQFSIKALCSILIGILILSVTVKVPNCCVQEWTGFTTLELISNNVKEILAYRANGD